MSCRHSLANGTCTECYPDTGTYTPQGQGDSLDGPGAVSADLVPFVAKKMGHEPFLVLCIGAYLDDCRHFLGLNGPAAESLVHDGAPFRSLPDDIWPEKAVAHCKIQTVAEPIEGYFDLIIITKAASSPQTHHHFDVTLLRHARKIYRDDR